MPRTFDEINFLASQVEEDGGYVRRGSGVILVRDVALEGLDALELVIRLNQRLIARAGSGRDEESYRQGRDDVLREVRKILDRLA